MSNDFVDQPLMKRMNKKNIISRLEQVESAQGAKPSAQVGAAGEVSPDTGEMTVTKLIIVDHATGIGTIIQDATGMVFENISGVLNFKDSAGLVRMRIYAFTDDHLWIINDTAGKKVKLAATTTNANSIQVNWSEDAGNANVGHLDVGMGTAGSKIGIGGAVVIWADKDATETVFNDDSYDIDFRVEGGTDTNLLKLDAGLDAVAMGGAADGDYKLKVYGNMNVTGAYTVNGVDTSTGWKAVTATWTRTGNHTFTVSSDQTGVYRKGTKVIYLDGGSAEYGVIASSSHAAGTTTVNLVPNTNYLMAAATITDTQISYIENPDGFPAQFDWTPTHTRATTPYTNVPTVTFARWKVIGTRLFFREQHQQNATPGGTGNQKFTLPVTPDATSSVSRSTGNGMNITTAYGLVVFVAEGEGARIFKYDATAEAIASNFYMVNGEYEL